MGVCNLFFLIKNKDGEVELITPKLLYLFYFNIKLLNYKIIKL